MVIRIKRAYEPSEESDGLRVLVDRLWPRGIPKAALQLAGWAKAIAPSKELHKWYNHDPAAWPEFRRRYFAELESKRDEVQQLVEMLAGESATLVYSSRAEWNNALALKEYLEENFPVLR